jgi:probable F420-dependent oxidoreductase
MSPIATPQVIAHLAAQIEAAGVESLWMGEHVVLFDEMEFPYPASRDGKIPVPHGGGMLDTVATFGFLAHATKALRLGTGIALISQRNPIYTAKEFATLDWLTGGRMDFGVGVGWCKEEVLASGYTWEDRGERSDEFLDLVGRLWRDEVTSFEGRHFSLAPCRLTPKPVQTTLPIIVGGHSPAAYRRAARFGQGWYGFALTPALVEKSLLGLDTALAREGRDRSSLEIIITPQTFRNDDVVAYRDLGVDRLVLHLGSQKPDAVARRLDEVAGFIAAS